MIDVAGPGIGEKHTCELRFFRPQRAVGQHIDDVGVHPAVAIVGADLEIVKSDGEERHWEG